ncbi:Maf family protein [Novilysobacter defluvii]|nr:nucleoside triphosphate pyrophosphatase [Lysobacter defluvii]
MNPPRLILASTSPYRRELLARLGLPFEAVAPGVEEAAAPDEPPARLAARLAASKAAAVAAAQPDGCWVLGSDQVADLDGQPLGKPGHREAAIAQLHAMSGRRVRFHTAVALQAADGTLLEALDTTTVVLRTLREPEIERYVDAERPFDCAGSFKVEGLGISLFEAVDNRDPTALVGLPLIATAGLLRQAGFAVP